MKTTPLITVRNLTIGYDGMAVLRNLSFDVNRGDIFAIMGASGSGKSTLLRAMTGLNTPMRGSIIVNDMDFLKSTPARREIMRSVGVSFQGGALLGAMTVGENVALPLMRHTKYPETKINQIVKQKLALVGLAEFKDYYPAQLSGGMKKRAGLARALALDPEIVYFDEPSAGLDPISSRHLDDLLLQINREFGTTIILVSHELESIFRVCNNSVFIDAARRTITAAGNPMELRRRPPNEQVAEFLTRGDIKNAKTTK